MIRHILVGLLIWCCQPAIGIGQTDHASLLPRQTVAAFSITDGPAWSQSWTKTGLAKFLQLPKVANYAKSFRENAGNQSNLFNLLSDLKTEQVQRLTFALLPSNTRFEPIVLFDVKNANAAKQWIADNVAKAKLQRAAVEQANMGQLVVTRLRFQNDSTMFVTSISNTVVAATSDSALNRLSQPSSSLLASSEFTRTAGASYPEIDSPVFWWFARPFEFMRFDSKAQSGAKRYELFRNEGFAAFQAMGGKGKIDPATNRMNSAGQILVAKPLQRSARLLDLPDKTSPALPSWCQSANTCGFLNLRTDQLLENFSTFFDATVGEGEPGVFKLVLQDMQTQRDGPQINLQQELMDALDGRAFFATTSNGRSQVVVVGLPAKNSNAIVAAVNKLFQGDSRATDISTTNTRAWKIMPLDDGYGIKDPFVVGIRDGFLFIAPNIESLNNLYRTRSSGSKTSTSDGEFKTSNLFVQSRTQRFYESIHRQLNSKNLGPQLKNWLTRFQLLDAVMNSDASGLPDPSEAKSFLNSALQLTGKNNEFGWKIRIRSTR